MANMEREAEVMVRRMEAARAALDFDALVAIGTELELIWRERNPSLYGQLALSLCRVLESAAVGDAYRRQRLLARFAFTALETPDALDVEGRVELLSLLPLPVATGSFGPFWASRRARAARLWLDTWREAAVSPPFRRALIAFLANAYALPPDLPDELKALMNERGIDDLLAREVLTELARLRNS